MHHSYAWKQTGHVVLWHYVENERNYPGWHLTADAAGCASLLALIDAFAADDIPVSRTVKVARPSTAVLGVPNNRQAAFESPAKLVLAFSANAADWIFPRILTPAELTVGRDWLNPLREGIKGITRGKGDHSIGGDRDGNCQLWFWAQPARD